MSKQQGIVVWKQICLGDTVKMSNLEVVWSPKMNWVNNKMRGPDTDNPKTYDLDG